MGFDSWDLYHVGEPNLFPGPIDNSGLFAGNSSGVECLLELVSQECKK